MGVKHIRLRARLCEKPVFSPRIPLLTGSCMRLLRVK